jgi:hypothetical protein
MSTSTKKQLKGLYYPYARSLDPTFIKQNLLLFDQIVFVDPLERAIMDRIGWVDQAGMSGHKQWDSIKDDYAFLQENGHVEIIWPFPIVRNYDGLMAQSMLCDLQDHQFMDLCARLSSKDYWGILREKFPPESLLAEALPFHGTRFWEQPFSIMFPRDDEREHHPYHDFSSPFIMSVAHDYIPVSCGYSVNTNLSLLLSEVNSYSLVTDDPLALQLLYIKYKRAIKEHSKPATIRNIIAKRTPGFFQKYSMLGLNVCEAIIPNTELEKRSFEEIVLFKESEGDSFERFKEKLFELVSYIESEPWSEEYYKDIIKILDTKVIPEARKIKDEMHVAYEKMFGSIITKSTATLTPTVAASLLSGLSSGQIITLSCAAVAGALTIALPEIVNLWQESNRRQRNAYSFLLSLQ